MYVSAGLGHRPADRAGRRDSAGRVDGGRPGGPRQDGADLRPPQFCSTVGASHSAPAVPPRGGTFGTLPMSLVIDANAEPIPGYRLIERIGGGGFGEVWKAEAPGGLHKAIKV